MAIIVASNSIPTSPKTGEPPAASRQQQNPAPGSCSLGSLVGPASDPCSLASLAVSIWDGVKIGAAIDASNLRQAKDEVLGGNVGPLLDATVVIGGAALLGGPRRPPGWVTNRSSADVRGYLDVAIHAVEEKVQAEGASAQLSILKKLLETTRGKLNQDRGYAGDFIVSMGRRLAGNLSGAFNNPEPKLKEAIEWFGKAGRANHDTFKINGLPAAPDPVKVAAILKEIFE